MSTYEYYVNDSSNISTKITIINNRILIDPEITTSLTSVVYSDPNIVVTFAAPLSGNEIEILGTIFRTVIDGLIPGVDFTYNNTILNPRNVVNSSINATNEYDIYSGYNIGSTIYDPIDKTLQVCLDSTENSAIWGKYGGLTGATGATGATGSIGAIGATGATGFGMLVDMQLVSSTSNMSTTSTSYNDISGASITTNTLGFVGNTGTYMITLMATVNAGLLASGIAIQLNVDSSDITSTEVTSTGTTICGISTAYKVNLLNGKVIKARWKSLGGTANINSYTMHIIGFPLSTIV